MQFIRNMFLRWAEDQEPADVINKVDDFIKLASTHSDLSEEQIKNYLETSEWYYRTLDNK